MAQENDPEKRQELQAAQAKVWQDVLNPIHAAAEEREQELSRQLGYESYVAISEEFREVDLKKLIAQLSLVAKNATKHKHDPEFIDDAVSTIENAVAKMNRLMAQL